MHFNVELNSVLLLSVWKGHRKQNKSDAKKLASFQKGLVQIIVHVNVCLYVFVVCLSAENVT